MIRLCQTLEQHKDQIPAFSRKPDEIKKKNFTFQVAQKQLLALLLLFLYFVFFFVVRYICQS
jgi:hypothetical protein